MYKPFRTLSKNLELVQPYHQPKLFRLQTVFHSKIFLFFVKLNHLFSLRLQPLCSQKFWEAVFRSTNARKKQRFLISLFPHAFILRRRLDSFLKPTPNLHVSIWVVSTTRHIKAYVLSTTDRELKPLFNHRPCNLLTFMTSLTFISNLAGNILQHTPSQVYVFIITIQVKSVLHENTQIDKLYVFHLG